MTAGFDTVVSASGAAATSVAVDWPAVVQAVVGWAVAGPWPSVAAFLAVVAGVLVWEQVLLWRHRRFATGARWVTVAAPPEVDPHSAAALWTTMAGVLSTGAWRRRWFGIPHVVWEYTWTGRTLTIRLWVPGTVPVVAVQAAVRAAWPACTVTVEEPTGPPIPLDVAAQVGGAWWPQEPDVLPLRIDHDADPLRPLLAAGAGIGHREHACVQVLARPAAGRRVRRAMAAASAPPGAAGGVGGGGWSGAGLVTGVVEGAARWAVEPVQWLLDAVLPGPARRTTPTRQPRPVRPVRDPLLDARHRAVADKAGRVPHFEIAVRYAVAPHTLPAGRPARRSPNRPEAAAGPPDGQPPAQPASDEQRHGDKGGKDAKGGKGDGGDSSRNGDAVRRQQQRLSSLAQAFAAAAATYTRPNRLRRMPMRHPAAVLAGRRLRRGFLATVEELAVLAALPQDLAVPGLDRARAKAMPAAANIPAGGRDVKVIGRAQIGGRSVGLRVVDARQHVHLIGKTGVGKSTLLLNMILADVHARRGAVVIDPRGDLVLDILDRLPAAYADRVAIIDPDQPNPACFNPLDDGGDPHLAVDNLVGVFSKIFQRHWGPRIDDTLRVSCLTLMRHANPTLALVPPLLNDRPFRSRFVYDLSDPEGLGGFWAWYDSMNEGMRAQVIGPVLARLRAFLLRDFVKDVIGTPHSTLNMGQILDGGLLLCRLPKGQLGEETARILGSLVVARTWQAATARAAQPEQQRRDATLYIDEVQNFLNLPGSVEDILAEARGFRLGLVLAHQNLAQLPAATAAAISANARSKIYFTVDPVDAHDLARHTRPELDEHDLAHLDVHTAAARLLVSNREMPAFTFTTNPPPAVLGETTAIRQAAAAARTRATVDTPMQQLARRTLHRRATPTSGPAAPPHRRHSQ